MVTYSDILAYSSNIDKLARYAKGAFLDLASGVKFDDWSVAADELRDLVGEAVDVYGLGSANLGAQWYEYCRKIGIGGEYEAVPILPTRAQVVGTANRRIDRLFIGEITTDEIVFELCDVVTMSVKDAARETVMGNMDIEHRSRSGKTKKITYARVPVGDSCAFCELLASRGFVYGSAKSATLRGDGNAYHEGCDCVAVPFSGPGSIEGYDYKQYEDKYLDAQRLLQSPPDDLSERIDKARKLHDERYEAGLEDRRWSNGNEVLIAMRYQNPGLH